MPHITPFHHKQSQPLQCSHHYCHIVDQLLHHPMFNIWNTLYEYKSMKRCLLQYLGTWELDPLLISPILQFLRNWGYTQLTRSIIEQFERSESTTTVLAAAQNTWNLWCTTIIGLGEEPCKEKEAEKDSGGFNPKDRPQRRRKIWNSNVVSPANSWNAWVSPHCFSRTCFEAMRLLLPIQTESWETWKFTTSPSPLRAQLSSAQRTHLSFEVCPLRHHTWGKTQRTQNYLQFG